jgi:hypothetical protein
VPKDYAPKMTSAAARVGVGNLRSGQKKACSAVEQKKEPEQARKSAREKVSARKKVLAFGVAIRERAILDRRCARRRRKSAVGQKKACGADARREELVAIIGAH